jgi:Transposase IS116/IS110/IS902 family
MSDTTSIPTPALRDIAAGLAAPEARWLVDYYYAVQDYRIQATGQARAVAQSADEGVSNLASRLGQDMHAIEIEIQGALKAYAKAQTPGRWAMSITGIGPVIAAGLLAHIDIAKAPTVGHIWRFAGLDPTVKWGKGEKRPWNASLKVLCWKIGDSFVKQSGRDSDIYGHVYRARKEQEVERNNAGMFADQAARSLEERNIKDKDLKACYESGRLPDGRIDLRARRYATKLFLSHLHHVMYECAFGEPPPKPYVIEHGGHVHFVAPPNWPM